MPGLEAIGYTVALVAAVLVLNPLIVAFVLIRGGFDGRTAVLTGLTLDQVSAFTLFIAIDALAAGTIAEPLFDAIVLSAAITMLVATYTTRHAGEINRWLRARGFVSLLGDPVDDRTRVSDDLEAHVILLDYQHGGQSVLEACAELDRPVLVVEDNPWCSRKYAASATSTSTATSRANASGSRRDSRRRP